MKYSAYYPIDSVNGEGIRSTLFVSGCEHACRGCYNQSTWSPSNGISYDQAMEDSIIADLKDTRINRTGLSLSGGDPMHPANIPELIKLCTRIREECPDKDIWLWTGYTHNEILVNTQRRRLVDLVDVLVDGKFEQDKKDPNLAFRGSSNQKIIKLLNTSRGRIIALSNRQREQTNDEIQARSNSLLRTSTRYAFGYTEVFGNRRRI